MQASKGRRGTARLLVRGGFTRGLEELRGQQFGTASIVSAERVVFNIKSNEFRLVAAVDYDHGVVLLVWLGTHRQYGQIDVKQVKFDKERYADSTGSN